ncbi:ABC transporter ATP-binding protein [Agrobacterium rhizogenes]|uniref:ABC transporter ATP-binding protein n=1 Tax=Rhizobium rhizogenes TaxID=359 RepID=UPI00080FA924|nr:ABC transporter ATP-binding protein [Rhizobium rhizogenes]OCJ17131.1 hypothetical protein A6U88_33660 [Agrobacterium sp. B131/95]OCJ22205.1 hypothetical protein A6U89_33140 [Agrobacterium sp. B133/95]NTI46165.1 ABC transporter ATP-binding protein [Rhizobium rhizogenes]NTI52857.1 ABC transporter ATP-binding protein [Rhizobium rhizogenes]NTI98230.1 ABC transporter ATP-binding protein [Rhizobium rhizogenes]
MLTIQSLKKSFDGRTVLDGVDVSIEDGKIFTVLGDSGCGKTTLLRILAGLETADSGRIEFNGATWVDSAARHLLPPQNRGIGLVFQSYAIWPHMTVGQNVAYPLRRAGLKRQDIAERVSQTLAIVGLAGFEQRSATRLSGGQQQRVAMARALAPEPKLLLLDEPFSNLDVSLRSQLRRELKDIQQRLGLTIVLVTHDQLDAFTLSDQVAVMRAGRVEQIGTAQEIYERPASDYIRSFVGRSSSLSAKVIQENGSELKVRLKGGKLTSVRDEEANAISVGTSISLWARPEDIVLCLASPEAQADDLAGRVREVTFIGDRFETVVDLYGGEPLLAYQSRSAVLGPGTEVIVRFLSSPTIIRS